MKFGGVRGQSVKQLRISYSLVRRNINHFIDVGQEFKISYFSCTVEQR